MKNVKFSVPTHLSPRKQPPCWTWRFQANFQHLPLGPMKSWQAENGWHPSRQGHDEIVAKSGFVKWMPDSHGFTPKNPGKNPNHQPPNETTNHQPVKQLVDASMLLPSSAPGIAAPTARKLGERHKAAKVPYLPPVMKRGNLEEDFLFVYCNQEISKKKYFRMYRVTSKARLHIQFWFKIGINKSNSYNQAVHTWFWEENQARILEVTY